MANPKEWKKKGVKIAVDDENADITDKPYGQVGPPQEGFSKVVRELVNFQVTVGGQDASVRTTFIVCYTAQDVQEAGGNANKLKLYWWDKNKSKWKNIPLIGDAPIPDGFTGFLGAKKALVTASWPDPPIAWTDGG
jgi:hypothetical protein